MNNRRRAITLMLGLAMSRVFAADGKSLRRIGFLTSSTISSQREEALRSGLKGLGWIEGGNLHIEYRRAGNSPERLAAMAKELVANRVELIVASTTTAVLAARNASSGIPIVTISADPVSNGFAKSLRKPGGNITGISSLSAALTGKRLEFLMEIEPRLERVAFLGYEPDPAHQYFLTSLNSAATAMSVQVEPVLIKSVGSLRAGLETVVRRRCQAIVVQTLLPIMGLGQEIAEFAFRERLLTCSESLSFVDLGGLLSYGHDPYVTERRLAIYVDRVLKGTPPAEIPIEVPQRFLLALNLKTAQRLKVHVPRSLRLRAGRIVE